MTTHFDPSLDLNDAMLAVREGRLTAPEREARRFLAARSPRLAGAFDTVLAGARRAILQRLTASLLRKGVLAGTERAHETLIALADGLLSVPIAARRAFGRLELAGPPCLTSGRGTFALTHPLELLTLVEGDLGDTGALAAELADGCANLAMARAYWSAKREHLAGHAGALSADSASALAFALRRAAPCFSAATFFERLCVEGPTDDPGAKARLGLSPQTIFANGPEFDGRPAMRFVGVLRQYLRWAGGAGPDDALMAAYPGLREKLGLEFAARGFDPGEYGFVPVHPWQFERVLPAVYRYELDEAIMVRARVAVSCEAGADGATLTPHGGGPLAFKVSLEAPWPAIAPRAALDAPRRTALLREIFAREPRRLAALQPIDEVASVCFHPADHEPASALHTRREHALTALYRTNAEALVGPDELAIAAHALQAESPVTGRSVAAELIALGAGGPEANARDFVSAYAEALVPGLLTLLTRYGVALDASQQNCVPVFRADGTLSRVLVRDGDGLRVHRGRLAAHGLHNARESGHLPLGDDLARLRARLFDTLFQEHLGHIVALAARAGGEPEAPYWEIVRAVCRQAYRALGAEPETSEAARADWEALSAAKVVIGGESTALEVPNPLHGGPSPW